jgi:hypothetical protein
MTQSTTESKPKWRAAYGLVKGTLMRVRSILNSSDTRHQTQSSAIASAINGAFEENPDHIFCVSDFGIPVTADEVNYPPYFCNRWVGSLNNDQQSFKWGAIPLGVSNPESLSDLLRNYAADNVILIRIMKPSSANAKILDISQTWWFKYADPSWKIITVAD